jgi:hypothetical protein
MLLLPELEAPLSRMIRPFRCGITGKPQPARRARAEASRNEQPSHRVVIDPRGPGRPVGAAVAGQAAALARLVPQDSRQRPPSGELCQRLTRGSEVTT